MVNSTYKITEEGYKDTWEPPAGICQIISSQSAKKFSPGQGTSQIIPTVDTWKSNAPNENIHDVEPSPTCITEEILSWTMSCNNNQTSQHIPIGDF